MSTSDTSLKDSVLNDVETLEGIFPMAPDVDPDWNNVAAKAFNAITDAEKSIVDKAEAVHRISDGHSAAGQTESGPGRAGQDAHTQHGAVSQADSKEKQVLPQGSHQPRDRHPEDGAACQLTHALKMRLSAAPDAGDPVMSAVVLQSMTTSLTTGRWMANRSQTGKEQKICACWTT